MSFLVVGTECTFLISVQKYIPKFIWSQHESEWNKPSVPELLSFTTQFLLTVNLPPQQLSEKKKLSREENGCNFGR